MSSDILNRKEFDIGVNGEGEETMVELLKTIYNKPGWKGVTGIYYRDNGEVVNTAPRQYIEDMDSLCFPAESAESSLKDYHKYPNSAFRYIFAIRVVPIIAGSAVPDTCGAGRPGFVRRKVSSKKLNS